MRGTCSKLGRNRTSNKLLLEKCRRRHHYMGGLGVIRKISERTLQKLISNVWTRFVSGQVQWRQFFQHCGGPSPLVKVGNFMTNWAGTISYWILCTVDFIIQSHVRFKDAPLYLCYFWRRSIDFDSACDTEIELDGAKRGSLVFISLWIPHFAFTEISLGRKPSRGFCG
jgi:hypothetical protein